MKAAAIQMTSGRDVERNLAEAARLIALAADGGAELAVLPENFSFRGAEDAVRLAAAAAPGDGPAQAFLAEPAPGPRLLVDGGTGPTSDRNDRDSVRTSYYF